MIDFFTTLPITPLLLILTVLPPRALRLNASRLTADTTGMKSKPEQPVSLESQCLVVLGRYAALETLTKAEQADFNGWVDRIGDAPGIEPATLPGIHGQLIAQGLLRFEFSGRARGLQYQLSPQGREALGRGTLAVSDDSSGDLRGSLENGAQAA
ncbi:MAG: hypothetical protein ACKO2L_07010 [Planctomycetaceae bacterium]